MLFKSWKFSERLFLGIPPGKTVSCETGFALHGPGLFFSKYLRNNVSTHFGSAKRAKPSWELWRRRKRVNLRFGFAQDRPVHPPPNDKGAHSMNALLCRLFRHPLRLRIAIRERTSHHLRWPPRRPASQSEFEYPRQVTSSRTAARMLLEWAVR